MVWRVFCLYCKKMSKWRKSDTFMKFVNRESCCLGSTWCSDRFLLLKLLPIIIALRRHLMPCLYFPPSLLLLLSKFFFKSGQSSSHITRILSLILELRESLRLRVAFSKDFENFWGEVSSKLLRIFVAYPRKPSNSEVRMRSWFLRFFEDPRKTSNF